MKKLTYFGLFICLFSVCLASSAYAMDFKSVDTRTANDTKAIQGLGNTLGGGSGSTSSSGGSSSGSTSSSGGSTSAPTASSK